MNIRLPLCVIMLAAMAWTCLAEEQATSITDVLNSSAPIGGRRKELTDAALRAVKADDVNGIRAALTTPGVKDIDVLFSVLREVQDPGVKNLYVQLLATKPTLRGGVETVIARDLTERTKQCESQTLLERISQVPNVL